MDGLVISSSEFRDQIQGEGLKSRRETSKTSSVQPPDLGTQERNFATTLNDAIKHVNRLQKESDIQMEKLATGKTQNVHETMIKAEKADIALRLMMQVRNKLIDAYQEIMKMQV